MSPFQSNLVDQVVMIFNLQEVYPKHNKTLVKGRL